LQADRSLPATARLRTRSCWKSINAARGVDERLAASERATEREREAARRLGRDKGELLLQLQEAAERCKERTS